MFILRRFISLFLSLIDMLVIFNGGNGNYMKNADVSIFVNKCSTYQTVNGFGTSACWWAQNAGDSDYADDIAKAFYSKDGLELNIYRYNIGGGEKDNPNSRIGGSRATESFYYYNESTGKYEYDFTRDAAAWKMMKKCLSYGSVDTVVLFANSPHYSMTSTGHATGGFESNVSNLPKENYEAYVDYFLTITQHFLDEGVPVKFISPINEPQWSWGGEWVGQEGCHYEPDEVLALLQVFAKEITARGMDVKLMAPESGEIGSVTENYFDSIYNDSEVSDVLGSLAYHSYWSDINTKGKKDFGKYLNGKYPNVSVDMTEWCELPCKHPFDDFESALIMARVISQDLALTGANSWTSWVGVNNYAIGEDGKKYSDGLLMANEDVTELYTAERYYALAHFSKFIPKGSVRIGAVSDVLDLATVKNGDLEDTTKSLNYSAYLTPDGKIVVVLVNEGGERNVNLNIVNKNMNVYTSSSEMKLENTYSGKSIFRVKIPENSITTIVYD